MKNLLIFASVLSAIIICQADPNRSTGMNSSGVFQITQRAYNNTPSRSIVTTAAAANGYQISPTKDADARYSLTISGTATIGGSCSGAVWMEICPTNSAVATDWVPVSKFGQGQSFGVVIGISCTQTITSSIRGAVPAGYYVRLRSITTAGTPLYSVDAGQEVLQ